jgi:hypothetical protein
MSLQKKDLRLVLTPSAGTINFFYAFVNGKRVIGAAGSRERSWKGEIADGETWLKVRVWGIDDAQYTAVIDLPGNVDDQKITFKLEGGYHEFEIRL